MTATAAPPTPPTPPARLPARACDHCTAPIVWTLSSHGTPMPIDADPSPHGNVLVEYRPDGTLAAGVAAPHIARAARAIGRPTYLHHALSCPFAPAWNKPGPDRARRRPARAGTGRRR